ncbi:MAG: sodium:solute symporter family protein [Bacteroidota bacterium]
MVSFSSIDIIIILSFFLILLLIGLLTKTDASESDFFLSNRKVGLLLFIFTNVSTWYGGILGIGEFAYRYGISSWTTQGLPYYIFAILFAFLLAGKIRDASLFTIPEKIETVYGRKTAVASSILIFVLVSPAPYLLMVASIIQLIFKLDLFISLIIASLLSSVYLLKSGFKSDLYTDVFQFFVMFIGFILIVLVSLSKIGSYGEIVSSLPKEHLSLTGNITPLQMIVWFLIALWTFADPGFHQRCYSAKDGRTAKYGILISVILWLLFDFLTNSTGLFARATLPNIDNPVFAFPVYAETILDSGAKGLFYAALFATILSTANSFLFLSGTTFSRDLTKIIYSNVDKKKNIQLTRIGIIISVIIAILLAYSIQSVVQIWFTVGSICIPGIILLIGGAYYEGFKIKGSIALVEIITATAASLIWAIIQKISANEYVSVIEPMIIGLSVGLIIHIYGLMKERL